MKTPREKFEEEVEARIEIKETDPDYILDNPGVTRDDMRTQALEDMVNMDDDFGGYFAIGILPRIVKADGTTDHAAMKRQSDHVAKLGVEHREWRDMRRRAKAELKKQTH